MNQDRIAGAARNVGGKIEGAIGEGLGDEKLQASGLVDEAKGKAQDLYGQAKDIAGNLKDAAGEAVETASDFASDTVGQGRQEAERYYRDGSVAVRNHVSASPLIAIAIAGAVGYLAALVLHNRPAPSRNERERDNRGRFKR